MGNFINIYCKVGIMGEISDTIIRFFKEEFDNSENQFYKSFLFGLSETLMAYSYVSQDFQSAFDHIQSHPLDFASFLTTATLFSHSILVKPNEFRKSLGFEKSIFDIVKEEFIEFKSSPISYLKESVSCLSKASVLPIIANAYMYLQNNQWFGYLLNDISNLPSFKSFLDIGTYVMGNIVAAVFGSYFLSKDLFVNLKNIVGQKIHELSKKEGAYQMNQTVKSIGLSFEKIQNNLNSHKIDEACIEYNKFGFRNTERLPFDDVRRKKMFRRYLIPEIKEALELSKDADERLKLPLLMYAYITHYSLSHLGGKEERNFMLERLGKLDLAPSEKLVPLIMFLGEINDSKLPDVMKEYFKDLDSNLWEHPKVFAASTSKVFTLKTQDSFSEIIAIKTKKDEYDASSEIFNLNMLSSILKNKNWKAVKPYCHFEFDNNHFMLMRRQPGPTLYDILESDSKDKAKVTKEVAKMCAFIDQNMISFNKRYDIYSMLESRIKGFNVLSEKECIGLLCAFKNLVSYVSSFPYVYNHDNHPQNFIVFDGITKIDEESRPDVPMPFSMANLIGYGKYFNREEKKEILESYKSGLKRCPKDFDLGYLSSVIIRAFSLGGLWSSDSRKDLWVNRSQVLDNSVMAISQIEEEHNRFYNENFDDLKLISNYAKDIKSRLF